MPAAFHRCTRDLLTVTGPDAVTWLQGQLSQDVAGLAVGDVTWTFVLAPQGKVDGWGRVQRIADDGLRIDVDPGAGEAWLTRLQRFKLRTKADLDLAVDVPIVAVRGDQPDGALPAGWPGSVGGDLLPAVDDADPTAGTWVPAAVAALEAAGAVEVDDAGYTALRILAGVPAWGAELDEDTIPATVGQWAIDASVSFTKGCYTGQELVARIDSRGNNVPRRLVAVRPAGGSEGGTAPAAGDDVVVDGEVRGVLTSVGVDADGPVALAYLQRTVETPAPAVVGGVAVDLLRVPVR
jgi:folate-binding protein YgfZ